MNPAGWDSINWPFVVLMSLLAFIAYMVILGAMVRQARHRDARRGWTQCIYLHSPRGSFDMRIRRCARCFARVRPGVDGLPVRMDCAIRDRYLRVRAGIRGPLANSPPAGGSSREPVRHQLDQLTTNHREEYLHGRPNRAAPSLCLKNILTICLFGCTMSIKK